MKVGLIREEKFPPDSRVSLTPEQCQYLLAHDNNLQIFVQPSSRRCFRDAEYLERNIQVEEDLRDCDLLLGVKEVPPSLLLPQKTYLFFSHTHKKQPYNRQLLQTILQKKIRLIDYECLRASTGQRVVAFGHWAGVVGTHNAILAWGKRTQDFDLKPMHQCHDFAEAQTYYKNLPLSPIKIVITGEGRVGNGAAHVLDLMGVKRVSATDFLEKEFLQPVYTQLTVKEMYYREGESIFRKSHYYQHPEQYSSKFSPYTVVSDIMINGIYWDQRIPVFFRKEDLKKKEFSIKVIADITCDLAPNSSIPCTLRASSISDPIYGYDPLGERETSPFQPSSIDIMAVDNLPNELPRDASKDFGEQLINHVWGSFNQPDSQMLYEATIALNGELNKPYEYLTDYVNNHE